MRWGGFGSYTGNNTSAHANRSAAAFPSYGRGNTAAGGRGHGYSGATGSSYGSSHGGYGDYGGSYKAPGTAAASPSAYRTGGLDGGGGDSSDANTGTARVAVIGTTQTAFSNWWALHAAGFCVRVMVGVEDAASATLAHPKFASEEKRRASAETARDVALRCARFYRLSPPACVSAASPSSANRVTGTAGSGVTTVSESSTTAFSASSSPPAAQTGTEMTAEAVEVRVRVLSSASLAPAPPPSSSSPAAVAGSATTAEAAREGPAAENIITATSWCDFFAGQIDGSTATATTSTTRAITMFGGNRSSNVKESDATATPPPMIDDVNVVFLVDCPTTNTSRAGGPAEAAENDSEVEDGVRAALLWLISKNKHVVVDCAISAATLAACASAAATMVRGKSELQHVFLYRGGGVRYGWSPAAMAQLRTALAVKRGTGKALAATVAEETTAATAKPTAAANTTTAASAATTEKTVALAKPEAAEADGGFSVFDFMGGDVNPFASSAAEAKPESTAANTKKSAAATTVAEDKEGGGTAAVTAAVTTIQEAPAAPSAVPLSTSIAVDADGGVAGALQLLLVTVRGSAIGSGVGGARSSLGVMATLGWDAVAWALHLLDWTCPDMVEGRVVRRDALTEAPLCVEATLYYGIDGSLDVKYDGGDKSQSGTTRPARLQYLHVSLYISATSSGDENSDGGGGMFQQSVRAIGTKAVVSVSHPLLPATSTAAVKSDAAARAAASSPAPFGSVSGAPSVSATPPFKVATIRTIGSATATTPTAAAAVGASGAATTPTLPSVPSIVYSYVVATQDVPPGSSVRMRKERKVALQNAEGEPCAEARLWQYLRSQLRVTTSTSYLTTTAASGYGAASSGGYQPYGSRYASRGRYGAGGSAYARGRGAAGQGYGGGGRGYRAAATAMSPTNAAGGPQTVVKAELLAPEAAALDVQHAWLVQTVVELILASATTS